MYDILDCRHMELLCRQRANADPAHGWKWLAREMGKSRTPQDHFAFQAE
jgi:hypothetical protein